KNKEQEQIKDEEKEVEKVDVDADSSKNNSQSGTKLSAKADTPSAACTLQRNHAKATAMAKSQVAPVRHREDQPSVAAPSPSEEGIPRQLLSQLYQDNDYMASLEHMANLAVCKNFTVRRNVLFWFWHYCQMHAKHVRSAADAKDYLANLMRQGSNTRAQFMAYQNHLYEQRSLAQHH
ncbi:MAG: FERM and PDZ domain-containing protein 3, partial [Segatella oris]